MIIIFTMSSVDESSSQLNPCRPEPGRIEGLKGLKTFWGTTKQCENKNFKLIFMLMQLSKNAEGGKG